MKTSHSSEMNTLASSTRRSLWSLLLLDSHLLLQLPPDIAHSISRFRFLLSSLVFLMAIVSACLMKITIIYMISQIQSNGYYFSTDQSLKNTNVDYNPVWLSCVWICISMPEVFHFIRCLVTYRKNSPSYTVKSSKSKDTLPSLLFEVIHASVQAFLYIVVLPKIGMLPSIMLTNSVSLIPSLQVIKNHRHEDVSKKFLLVVVSLAQGSSFLFWPTFFSDNMRIILPLAIFTISIGLQQRQLRILENIRAGLNVTSVDGVWKDMGRCGCRIVVYTLCFTYVLFNCFQATTLQKANSVLPSIGLSVPLISLAIHGISMTGFYLCAKLFLRLSSRGVFFLSSLHVCLPLVIFFIISSSSFSNHSLLEELQRNSEQFISAKVLAIWMAWILSQTITNIYLWLTQKKLIGARKCFPEVVLQAGLFLEQALFMKKEDIFNEKPSIIEGNTNLFVDFDSDYESSISYSGENNNEYKNAEVPQIYACATMWHETRDEMMKLLKSLCHMDDYCNNQSPSSSGTFATSRLKFESHIFFDDAFEYNASDKKADINKFVKDFLATIKETVYSVYGKNDQLSPPRKMETPYGGQLQYTLPGGTYLTVHLKNKNKIRIKKRWSQVMYLYYLLGHKLIKASPKTKQLERMSKNTYLLVLDGDVTFEPYAVQHLVRRMTFNDRLAAVCGRVHPVGSGPLVWYQTFEYAVSHWLCKATEDVVGSILCSPGCFSLLRAKPLMDDTIMKQFVSNSKTPFDFILHDQGEDRWLCTLLMQRGHCVEYSAVSDVYTNAPESFSEFFAQRKRWMPSTIAHSFDLLYNYEAFMKVNHRITVAYIAYQVLMMMITLCSPSVIFLITIRSLQRIFALDLDSSFCINLFFLFVFILTCLLCSQETQITCAKVWTVVYFGLLMETLLSIVSEILMQGFTSSASIIFLWIFCAPLLTAAFHPLEFSSLRHFIVYWLLTPCTNLLLPIYVLFNVSQISWGTRETPKSETDDQEEEYLNKSRRPSLIEVLTESPRLLRTLSQELPCDEIGQTLISLFDESNDRINKRNNVTDKKYTIMQWQEGSNSSRRNDNKFADEENKGVMLNESSEWMQNNALMTLESVNIMETEETFWKEIIKNYLHPNNMDSSEKNLIATQLFTFKYKCVAGFFAFNVVILSCLLLPEKLGLYFDIFGNMITSYYPLMSDPFNLFLIMVASILFVVQFFVMLVHRYRTLSDIILEPSLKNAPVTEET